MGIPPEKSGCKTGSFTGCTVRFIDLV